MKRLQQLNRYWLGINLLISGVFLAGAGRSPALIDPAALSLNKLHHADPHPYLTQAGKQPWPLRSRRLSSTFRHFQRGSLPLGVLAMIFSDRMLIQAFRAQLASLLPIQHSGHLGH